MIIIYSNQITNRLRYITKVLFEEVLKCDAELTNELEKFNSSEKLKINYSPLEIKDVVKITPQGLLSKNGVQEIEIPLGKWNGHITLFPNEDKEIPFDLFSAAFYLVSRYEEYTIKRRDHYNRFVPEESIAFKNDFLQKPVVNIWMKQLKELLDLKNPNTRFPELKYEFIPTIDVDNAYAYLEKGMVRTLGAFTRSLLLLNFDDVKDRFKCIIGMKKDPFDSFDYLLEIQKQYGLRSVFFFLVGDYSLNDKNVPISSRKFRSLIKHVGDYSEIGIHPSFASNDEKEKVKIEIDRLSNVIHKPITCSRQHFLTLSFPQTYKTLIDDGITDDHTMGYASQLGFRASICTPYSYYDLSNEQQTNLMIHPFCGMEATLRHYQNVKPEAAMEHFQPIIDEVKAVEGTMVVLWHNDSLSEISPWVGWSKLYERLVKAAV